ncbi:MAG: gfo/Idh/MocA family oxidoreductase, partial [Oscillospiraceae bacterium]|nr:gfo/Idh/MocA family oxidoreductase [Clostridiales bacterium]MDD7248709.1 gfo/Idh/MocA family oxidoreductase [Clostridiales bacterium]MDY2717678.1 gfo/Idh/MocA family oxidoreductase [Oscillospiraceae bacterium]MDY2718920.1 gfo/Idh/MocA family oxidoreductase [Oscillospiraceae bacterium]
PNQFGAPVYLQKPLCEPVEFPFTHGYQENSRGLGAAEMAWSILAGRDHRASKEMAYHVFETMHGIMTSAETGSFYQLQSTFQTPAALPAGYRSVGDWSRKEESALI